MGRIHVGILHNRLAEHQAAALGERNRRQAFRRQRIDSAVERLHSDLLAQPFLHILVSHDLDAGLAESHIRSHVIHVPMGVEQEADGVRIEVRNRPQQLARALRKAAIDHEKAVVADQHGHVAAVAADERQLFGQFGGFDRAGRSLPEYRPGKGQPCRAPHQCPGEFATIGIEVAHRGSLPRPPLWWDRPSPFVVCHPSPRRAAAGFSRRRASGAGTGAGFEHSDSGRGRLKSITGPEMCRLIELNGWSLRRVKGSHHIYSESGERKVISIPVLPRLPRRKNCRDLQSQPILD